MNTAQLPASPRKTRGRPGGLLPNEYNHALLLDRFNSQRNMDLKATCGEVKISRQHFYDIINARVTPTRDRVEVVARILGVSISEVFPSEN